MSDIVERLQTWCHAVDAESAQDLMDEAANEIGRLRLTEEELDAIEHGLERLELHSDTESEQSADTLRKLLRRAEQ